MPPAEVRRAARVFAFGLGSDANGALLEALANSGHGYFARARETEDIATALKIFFEHVGSLSIEDLHLTSAEQNNLYQVYATGDYSFDGSSLAFVGRYKQPTPQTTISVQGQYGTEAINLSRNVSLPEFADTHEHLPRLWARARVDALLREMDTKRRAGRLHRGDHSPLGKIQVRDALHGVHCRAARAVASATDSTRRSGLAREDRRIDQVSLCSAAVRRNTAAQVPARRRRLGSQVSGAGLDA